MSAPVANPAVVTAGQTPAGNAWAQAKGAPVTGFEALLATLFPASEPGAVAGMGKGGLGLLKNGAQTAAQLVAGKTDQDTADDTSALQAQLAALLAAQPAPALAAPKDAAGEDAKPAPTPGAPVAASTPLAAQTLQAAVALLPEATAGGALPASAATVAGSAPAPQLAPSIPAPAQSPAAAAKAVPDQPPVQPAAEPKAPPALILAALAPIEAPTETPPELRVEAPVAAMATATGAKPTPTPKAEKTDAPEAARAASSSAGSSTPALASLAESAAAAQPAQAGGDGGRDQPPPDQRETTPSDQGAPDIAAGPTTGPASAAHLIQAEAAAVAARGSPETVAKLAAQIVKKLDGKSSRFDIALDPVGLGKVDVKVEINAQGQMTAALNFDNALAANDLRGRAGELRAALEQAGFDMNNASLSFNFSGQGDGSGQAFAQRDGQGGATRFLQAVADDQPVAAGTSTPSLLGSRTSGVDVRI